jgi:hypothetical protein
MGEEEGTISMMMFIFLLAKELSHKNRQEAEI